MNSSRVSSKECIQCDSKIDSKCIELLDSNHKKVCKNNDDKCFIHIGKFSIERGCSGDQSPDFIEICQNDGEKCSLCNENNCNNHSIALETCISCNSTIDEKCQQRLDSYKGKICSTIHSNDKFGCFLSMVNLPKSFKSFQFYSAFIVV